MPIMCAILVFVASALPLQAEEVVDTVEIDHPSISTQGYPTATITVKSQAVGRASEFAQCAASDKFPVPQKLDNGFRIVIDATSLAEGANQIFICFDKSEGREAAVKPITLVRNDAPPRITFTPVAGEYGKIPEIKITAAGAALMAYALGGEVPQFAPDGTLKSGRIYADTFKPVSKNFTLNARAISAAGVISPVVSAAYKENSRLAGWNSWDLFFGGIFMTTTSSVNSFLPSGLGMLVGARRGLDDLLTPGIFDINKRHWWLPGVFAEGQYLSLNNNPNSESIVTFMAGPEWQLALTPREI